MPERPPGFLTLLAAGRTGPMSAVLWMALAAGGPLEPAVADDVVIEEEQAKEVAGAEAEKAAEEAAGVAADPKKKRKFTPKK